MSLRFTPLKNLPFIHLYSKDSWKFSSWSKWNFFRFQLIFNTFLNICKSPFISVLFLFKIHIFDLKYACDSKFNAFLFSTTSFCIKVENHLAFVIFAFSCLTIEKVKYSVVTQCPLPFTPTTLYRLQLKTL